MKIDRAGIPFIAAAAVPAVGARRRPGVRLGGAVRHPGLRARVLLPRPRAAAAGRSPTAVVSPADGRVMVAGAPQPARRPPGDWQQVSIFLSPLDVHVNRMPVSGRVTKVDYRPGRLPRRLPARGDDRERAQRGLDRRRRAGPSSAGRSPACWSGASCAACGRATRCGAGERFGVMKFGSRIDLFLPAGTRLRRRGRRPREGGRDDPRRNWPSAPRSRRAASEAP